MTALLNYETPLHVETRCLPARPRNALAVGLAVLGVVAVGNWIVLHRFLGSRLVALCLLGPCVAAAAIFCVRSISAVTQVFSDRMQVDFFASGVRLWSYRYPWATVIDAKLVRDRPPGRQGFYALRRAPGITMIFHGDGGILLTLAPRGRCWIGSDDPARLDQAVQAARTGVSNPDHPQPALPLAQNRS